MVVDLGHAGLPPYCLALLDEVRSLSGRPLRIIEEPGGLEFDSEIRMARRGETEHVLSYRPEYRAYRAHFAVSSALKVLRQYREPPELRLMPYVDPSARLPDDEERVLRQCPLLSGLPVADVRAVSSFMHQGLLRQLTSFPVDLRVEREIAPTLPEHAGRQQAYFRRQVADLVPHFAPELERLAPPRTYRAISAMNVVLGIVAAEIGGVPEHPVFRGSPHRTLGEALHDDLHAIRAPGRVGDYALTDRWAEQLGLWSAYHWAIADDRSRA